MEKDSPSSSTAKLAPTSSPGSKHGSLAQSLSVVAGPPLDYSFKDLKTFEAIIDEEPNSGTRKPRPVAADSSAEAKSAAKSAAPADAKPAAGKAAVNTSQQAIAQPQSQKQNQSDAPKPVVKEGSPVTKHAVQPKVVINSVRLNNNQLQPWSGLVKAMTEIMESPLVNLTWIDLSFNNFVDIDVSILEFTNLRNIHLHCNKISSFAQVEKLGSLPNLHSITLHGNPLEQNKQYKTLVIAYIPTLKQIDFSPITRLDRDASATWMSMHKKKKSAEPAIQYDEL